MVAVVASAGCVTIVFGYFRAGALQRAACTIWGWAIHRIAKGVVAAVNSGQESAFGERDLKAPVTRAAGSGDASAGRGKAGRFRDEGAASVPASRFAECGASVAHTTCAVCRTLKDGAVDVVTQVHSPGCQAFRGPHSVASTTVTEATTASRQGSGTIGGGIDACLAAKEFTLVIEAEFLDEIVEAA